MQETKLTDSFRSRANDDAFWGYPREFGVTITAGHGSVKRRLLVVVEWTHRYVTR